ncbi:hypothetical protein CDAR_506061 [Caerostris darwini]|uniref:Uncharacterized protein n=1 Tax=Caerostris darwini TaxID=1538125 RepID=A0AAV4WGX3_9ARAC|nr:hypothetical protein CDAR_506061 [Caerostris darwini]
MNPCEIRNASVLCYGPNGWKKKGWKRGEGKREMEREKFKKWIPYGSGHVTSGAVNGCQPRFSLAVCPIGKARGEEDRKRAGFKVSPT